MSVICRKDPHDVGLVTAVVTVRRKMSLKNLTKNVVAQLVVLMVKLT